MHYIGLKPNVGEPTKAEIAFIKPERLSAYETDSPHWIIIECNCLIPIPKEGESKNKYGFEHCPMCKSLYTLFNPPCRICKRRKIAHGAKLFLQDMYHETGHEYEPRVIDLTSVLDILE